MSVSSLAIGQFMTSAEKSTNQKNCNTILLSCDFFIYQHLDILLYLKVHTCFYCKPNLWFSSQIVEKFSSKNVVIFIVCIIKAFFCLFCSLHVSLQLSYCLVRWHFSQIFCGNLFSSIMWNDTQKLRFIIFLQTDFFSKFEFL